MDCVLSVVDEGTFLRLLVAQPGGEVIGYATDAGPANVRFIGFDGLRRKLRALLATAFAGQDEAFCLAAVAAVHADPERVRTLLAELVPLDRERVFPLPIERLALAGAIAGVEFSHAVVIRADIGARGFGIAEPGREAWRGGFGEVLGDEGSAYAIGLQGVRAALKAYERRSRNTMLKPRLVTHFGVTTYQALVAADHEPPVLDRYAIASFAPQVFEAAEQDDDLAIEILDQAGRELANMALALVADLDLGETPFAVLPSGSVFQTRTACLEAFMKILRNKTTKANLLKEGMGPAAGGALLAVQQLGLKVRPETAEVLRSTLRARE